jgi:hypothetical protein
VPCYADSTGVKIRFLKKNAHNGFCKCNEDERKFYGIVMCT